MAEFCKIIELQERICSTYGKGKGRCRICPLFTSNNGLEFPCSILLQKAPSLFETLCLRWEEENPLPLYPTWEQWQTGNFVDATYIVRPCSFMACGMVSDCRHIESRTICQKYREPIPEHIAKKLGIEPIED